MSDTKPRTMADITKAKKDLIKKHKKDPDLVPDLDAQLEKLESMFSARISRLDQSYCRNFVRLSMEHLPKNVFDKLADMAGTRQHFHQSGHQTGNK